MLLLVVVVVVVVVTEVLVVSGVTRWGVPRPGRPGVSVPLWWRMRMPVLKVVLFGWMLIGRRAVVPGDRGEVLCLRGDRGGVMVAEVVAVVGLRPLVGAQAAPLHLLRVGLVVPGNPGEHGGGGGGVEMRGGRIGSMGGAPDSAP